MSPEIRRINLKLEKALEHWKIHHALREIIANALDEQAITDTKDIDIFQDKKNHWHIRDFGRGINPEAFTQTENEEKAANPNVSGKFGAGLKNALATLNRQGIKVVIKSCYGLYTFGKSSKDAWDKVITLIHIYPPKNPHFLGTEYIFTGIRDEDIEKAKSLFLKFRDALVLDSTPFGQVLKKTAPEAGIYLYGVKVAEEENFLFSYNITALEEKIVRNMHRERPNAERSVYAEPIRNILTAGSNQKIARALINDLSNYDQGTNHDELRWLDVQENAVKTLNSFSKVVFLTVEDQNNFADFIEQARRDGYDFINIPSNLKERLKNTNDITGVPVRIIDQFYKHYEKGFRFLFIDPKNLSPAEREIFGEQDALFNFLGGRPPRIREIKISEKMRKEMDGQDAVSLWIAATGTIIIKRSELKSRQDFAAALLHETAHALSRMEDGNRGVEQELTKLLGILALQLLQQEPAALPKPGILQKLFKKT